MNKLIPGVAYRHTKFKARQFGLAGPWAIAATETTFLTDTDGLTKFFASRKEAEEAYRQTAGACPAH
jgi:hypothetical protein